MTSSFPRLIGIHAPYPGSGKSTIAHFLARQYNYHCVPFAKPLKMMMQSLLHNFGYSDSDSARLCNDPNLKHSVIPELGVTPRYMMQTLATEWGRDLIHKELWAKTWRYSIESLGSPSHIVVDDVRFPDEVHLVKSIPNSTLWWVENPKIYVPPDVMNHSSQQTLDRSQFDHTLVNDGTLEDLYAVINQNLFDFN